MSYGTTVERLRQLNALSRSERLKADQVIRVPAPAVEVTPPAAAPAPSPSTALAARSHRVRRGETLTSIASRYGVTITALRDANGLASTSMIKAGTQLTIPE
jgi:LysM repeat protein